MLAGKTIVQVAAGAATSFALDSTGALYSWGSNAHGQLGRQDVPIGGDTADPGAIAHPAGAPPGLGYRMVSPAKPGSAAGNPNMHVLALGTDGRVYSWGGNISDRLGRSDTATGTDAPLPGEADRVTAAVTAPISQVVAGPTSSSFVVTDAGQAYSWGGGSQGSLANGSTASSSVVSTPGLRSLGCLGGRTVTHLELGFNNGIALTSDGAVCTWGLGDHGQTMSSGTWTTGTPKLLDAPGLPSGVTIERASLGVSQTTQPGGNGFVLGSDGRIYVSGTVGANAHVLGIPGGVAANRGGLGNWHHNLSANFDYGEVTWDGEVLSSATELPGGEAALGSGSVTIVVPPKTRTEVGTSTGLTVEVRGSVRTFGGADPARGTGDWESAGIVQWDTVQYTYWPFTPDPVVSEASTDQASGSGVAGATITVSDPDGGELCTTIVAADGDWRCGFAPGPLAVGDRVTVVQSEPAENRSGPSLPVAAQILAKTHTKTPSKTHTPELNEPEQNEPEPETPEAPAPQPESAQPSIVRPTEDAASGSGVPGATITVVHESGDALCTVTVDAASGWACRFPTSLQPGTAVSAVQQEPEKTAAPPVTATVARPLSIDRLAHDSADGTGEPASTITVTAAGSGSVCTNDPVRVAPALGWSCALRPGLPPGTVLTATQIDPDGSVTGVRTIRTAAADPPSAQVDRKPRLTGVTTEVTFSVAESAPPLWALMLLPLVLGAGLTAANRILAGRRPHR